MIWKLAHGEQQSSHFFQRITIDLFNSFDVKNECVYFHGSTEPLFQPCGWRRSLVIGLFWACDEQGMWSVLWVFTHCLPTMTDKTVSISSLTNLGNSWVVVFFFNICFCIVWVMIFCSSQPPRCAVVSQTQCWHQHQIVLLVAATQLQHQLN